MALANVRRLDVVSLTGLMSDVSAATSVLGGSAWIHSPIRGRIVKIRGVLHGAITVADSAITLAVGGTTVTSAAATIVQSGSAAGDKYTITMPVSAATGAMTKAMGWVEVGDNINIISDGGSTTTAAMTWVVDIAPATSSGSIT